MKDVILFWGGISMFILSVCAMIFAWRTFAYFPFFSMLGGLVIASKGWEMHNTIHVKGNLKRET